jgi:hypothetical protein
MERSMAIKIRVESASYDVTAKAERDQLRAHIAALEAVVRTLRAAAAKPVPEPAAAQQTETAAEATPSPPVKRRPPASQPRSQRKMAIVESDSEGDSPRSAKAARSPEDAEPAPARPAAAAEFPAASPPPPQPPPSPPPPASLSPAATPSPPVSAVKRRPPASQPRSQRKAAIVESDSEEDGRSSPSPAPVTANKARVQARATPGSQQRRVVLSDDDDDEADGGDGHTMLAAAGRLSLKEPKSWGSPGDVRSSDGSDEGSDLGDFVAPSDESSSEGGEPGESADELEAMEAALAAREAAQLAESRATAVEGGQLAEESGHTDEDAGGRARARTPGGGGDGTGRGRRARKPRVGFVECEASSSDEEALAASDDEYAEEAEEAAEVARAVATPKQLHAARLTRELKEPKSWRSPGDVRSSDGSDEGSDLDDFIVPDDDESEEEAHADESSEEEEDCEESEEAAPELLPGGPRARWRPKEAAPAQRRPSKDKRRAAAATTAPAGEWACRACTLQNEAGAEACNACGGARPAAAGSAGGDLGMGYSLTVAVNDELCSPPAARAPPTTPKGRTPGRTPRGTPGGLKPYSEPKVWLRETNQRTPSARAVQRELREMPAEVYAEYNAKAFDGPPRRDEPAPGCCCACRGALVAPTLTRRRGAFLV